MRDSQREPGGYPRRSASGPSSNQPSRPRPKSESAGQPRQATRHPGTATSDAAPRARLLFNQGNPPPGRPRLPSSLETREAHAEREERLRAMRQDFLDHAQTKIKPQKPRNVWLAVLLTLALLVITIMGIVAVVQLRPTLFSSGGQTIATQFMDAMQQKNYTAAYADCTSNVQETFTDHSGALSQSDFLQQAQAADQLGPIINYSPAGSHSLDSNNEQYTFSVTRSHQQPVNVTIGVTKGSNGSWKVSGIDNAIFPLPPPPTTTPTPTSDANLPGGITLAEVSRSGAS
ncbi:MAG TPA: hypothetical protein VFU69_12250 [Ktedonobacterales bacterium]|nr:hypothetical protein [Ktedonobacterales bacterium]